MDKTSFVKLFTEEMEVLPSPLFEDTEESFCTERAESFFQYWSLLVTANENINLTAITEPREVIRKHFFDSLLPMRQHLLQKGNTAADVGSGAGFPGLPLAICLPEVSFTLIEPIGKRASFLETVISELGLKNCRVLKLRAEDAGREDSLREAFDLTLSRAVSRLNILSEYCLPLTKVGGRMLALKSVAAEEELTEARAAISLLGGGEILIQKENSASIGERNVVVIEKSGYTPDKYPRRAGMPEKKPLRG